MTADLGLQPERTALAWQRTGVAGCAVAGSALIAAAHVGPPWLVRAAALVAALAALAVAVAVQWSRRPGPRRDSPWSRLLVLAAVPALLGPIGALLALLG